MVETLVIVTGADTPTGLSTARAIRRTGVATLGVIEDDSAPAAASRCWAGRLRVSGSPDEQLKQLICWGKNQSFKHRPVLLFSQDSHVQAAWRLEDELSQYFQVPLPVREKGELMMDKTSFHEWALINNIGVPESRVVENHDALIEAGYKLKFPLILKPLVRSEVWNKAFKSQKFFTLASQQQLSSFATFQDPFQFADRFVLQEWIPGGDSEVFFVLLGFDEKGNVLSRVGGRKIWQWPPLGGSTALCQLWPDPVLLDLGESIARKLNMVGLGSIEFKRDPRSGRYLVTEPTVGRNDYQSDIATLDHQSPTEALVRHSLGVALPDFTKSRDQMKQGLWIDELSSWRYLKDIGFFRGLLTLVRVVISQRRIRCLYFSWTDLSPFLLHFRRTLRRQRR